MWISGCSVVYHAFKSGSSWEDEGKGATSDGNEDVSPFPVRSATHVCNPDVGHVFDVDVTESVVMVMTAAQGIVTGCRLSDLSGNTTIRP